MFSNKMLHIYLSDEPGELTLEQALCGAAGTLHLGRQGVRLWTPNMDIPAPEEMICDVRYEAISDAIFERFREAAKGHFLPAHMAVFRVNDANTIQRALQFFDFALVPDKTIENSPADFRRRVLGYETKEA